MTTDNTEQITDTQIQSALKDVLGGILQSAAERCRQDDGYQHLFSSFKDGGVEKAVFDAERQMSRVAMGLMQVLRDASGTEIDNDLFAVIMGLPLTMSMVRKDISAREGHACCVDKARLVLKTYFYDRLGMNVEVASFVSDK